MDQNAYNFLDDNSAADPGKKKRIIIAGGGLLVLVVVIAIILMVAFGGKPNTQQLLLPVSATQADLIAITNAGSRDLRSSNLINKSTTTRLVVSTHNNTTNSWLGKDAAKAAGAYQDNNYTSELNQASSNGTFDDTYEIILSQRLDLYRQRIISAYSEIEDQAIKQQLAKFNDEANLLAGEPTQP